MSTLISVHTSEGEVGRCDAKCYDAKDPHCDCICRGANHGAGLQRAQENTQRMADDWMENWNRQHPGAIFKFDVPPQQASLFTEVKR